MYILDTDTLSDYLDSRRSRPALRSRIQARAPADIGVTAVTVEEILRGVLDGIHQSRGNPRRPESLIRWYRLLVRLMSDLAEFTTLTYDERAEVAFQRIPASVRRRHPRDCAIAAIALSRGDIVVTANTRHFDQIPGLKIEDWTAE